MYAISKRFRFQTVPLKYSYSLFSDLLSANFHWQKGVKMTVFQSKMDFYLQIQDSRSKMTERIYRITRETCICKFLRRCVRHGICSKISYLKQRGSTVFLSMCQQLIFQLTFLYLFRQVFPLWDFVIVYRFTVFTKLVVQQSCQYDNIKG